MGLFKKIGGGIGKFVSWVGKKTGIEAIEKAGNKIQDACRETSERTGRTREYDQETATVDETIRISEILTGFSQNLKEQGDTLERNVKDNVNEFFDQLYHSMREALRETGVVRTLQIQKQTALSLIDGAFNETIARRASLSDSECTTILKMPKGSEKEKKMELFGKKIIREGLERLCSKLDEIVTGICENIRTELGDMVEQQQKQLEKLSLQLNDLVDKKQDISYHQEESMLFPAEKLAVSKMIVALL